MSFQDEELPSAKKVQHHIIGGTLGSVVPLNLNGITTPKSSPRRCAKCGAQMSRYSKSKNCLRCQGEERKINLSVIVNSPTMSDRDALTKGNPFYGTGIRHMA